MSRIKGILNYKKPGFWIILTALIACIAVAVCFLTNPKKDVSDMQAEEKNEAEEITVPEETNTAEDMNAPENMDVSYSYENGEFVVIDRDGKIKTFQYRKELRGRDPGAACDGMFIVLTNDPDMTYERVSRSIYSSNSTDWMSDTIILGMHTLDDNGDIIDL